MIKKILKYFFLIISIIFFVSCSSSKRFSSAESDTKSVRNSEAESLETKTGEASYYASEYNGNKTANGEIYNMYKLTAAHPTYPFNTIVRVTNLSNNKNVEVRINDRMPNFKGRIIDLSLAAAKEIDMISAGVQEVRVEVLKWGNN
jgi:rare lipoprotein A